MIAFARRSRRWVIAFPVSAVWLLGFAGALLLATCSNPVGPGPAAITFSMANLELVPRDGPESRFFSGAVTLTNTGIMAVGPVVLSAHPAGTAGVRVPGVVLGTEPGEIPTLNPGGVREIVVSARVPGTAQAGIYQASVGAQAGNDASATLGVRFQVEERSEPVRGAGIAIAAGNEHFRQGDVVHFSALVRDSAGAVTEEAEVIWSVVPEGGGFFDSDGRFVAYRTGEITVVASASLAEGDSTRQVVDSARAGVRVRAARSALRLEGIGRMDARYTSDLWVHGDYAYTGTWGRRRWDGNRLYIWKLDAQGLPTLLDSMDVDARTVNDVKIRADGRIGVLTHENGDGDDGITLFDLADPGHPEVVSRYTHFLEAGVHNAWLEGDYAYLVEDGFAGGLRIVDISDPASPQIESFFNAKGSILHDVYVRDGLAFLSHWDAGLVILDVGNGMAGGSPADPIEVSRLTDLGGDTHNVWYWPESGYAFVGDEKFGYSTGPSGAMRVVDLQDLTRPKVVATYEVPEASSHNYWLDESTGTLYLAWYEQGVRILDVNGELMGQLELQGRETGFLRYAEGEGFVPCPMADSEATCAWAPQLHENGKLYVSDMHLGLVVLQPRFF